uniref:C3H1-type domain-containing protein n=1 Tax=Panagrolaimus sp. JU765 TaxID=591449 RepID=A0AC34QVZ4_9BILA
MLMRFLENGISIVLADETYGRFVMTDSDNEPGALSSESEDERGRTSGLSKTSDKDVISLREGESDSDDANSRFSTLGASAQKMSTDDLTGVEAISSDDEDDSPKSVSNVERSQSPKTVDEESEEPPAKKVKQVSRDDLEDGELTSDSEEEAKASPKSDEKQHPKIDFPRFQQGHQNHLQNRRRRPEDYGICKFYLRGNCTWDKACKYAHPTGAEKTLWLAECGLPDPATVTRKRPLNLKKISKSRSGSPKSQNSWIRSNSRRSNGSQKSLRKASPRASPISSSSSRSASSEDERPRSKSPTPVSISSENSASKRSPKRKSPDSRRRARSISTSSGSSRSRSSSPINPRAQTTLGALLRKKRLESMQKSDSQPEIEVLKKSESPQNTQPSREEKIRRFFTKNPDNEPEIYKKHQRKSPTPEPITSSDDSDGEVFRSPAKSPLVTPAEIMEN